MFQSVPSYESLPNHLRDPLEILDWAGQRYPEGLVLASALGPQSIVAMDLALRRGVRLDVVLLDTGLLFEQTLDLAERLEDRFGIKIERIQPDQSLEEQRREHGDALWEHNPSLCCELRKVRPLARRLKQASAWITGLRRSGSLTRADVESVEWDSTHDLVKINPLAWWPRARVFAHIHDNDLPYNPLLDEGYASVGCAPCTSPVRPGEDERAGRWRGRGKTECGIHQRRMRPQAASESLS